MVLFRMRLRVPQALRDSVRKSILRQMGPTRAAKGCAACGAFVDIEDDNVLVYVEEWESRDALHARLRTENLKVLLSVMDLAEEPPTVQFDTVTETRGMEVIAAARSGSRPEGDGPDPYMSGTTT